MNHREQYTRNKTKYFEMRGGKDGTVSEIFNDIQLVHVVREYVPEKFKFMINNNRFQINELTHGTTYEIAKPTITDTAKIKTNNILDYDQPLNMNLMKRLIDHDLSYRGYVHCCWGTIVHPHRLGRWENPAMIIITPLALQQGRIMICSPLDTMILDYLTYNNSSFLICDNEILDKMNEDKILETQEVKSNKNGKINEYGLINGINLYTFNRTDKINFRTLISRLILSRFRKNIVDYQVRTGREFYNTVSGLVDDNRSTVRPDEIYTLVSLCILLFIQIDII